MYGAGRTFFVASFDYNDVEEIEWFDRENEEQ